MPARRPWRRACPRISAGRSPRPGFGSRRAAAAFRVARRSSVMKRGAGASARAGAMLGVDAVVEGSVRTVGGRYRIHVELVGAKSRFQIWSGTFTSAGEAILSGDATTVNEIAGQMKKQAGAR